jgi:ppGpp synthetase/RelA/SpoT-type nucleotidyltranferase
MLILSRSDRLFLEKQTKAYSKFEKAAVECKSLAQRILRDSFIPIHLVESRAKSIDSLRGKLRRKRYTNPAVQVTDLVALRVITYFWEDVDRVATELRNWVEVSEIKSRDARAELEPNQFGYRSLHLIARLRPTEAGQPHYKTLGRRWFEIQIRSILDHAWSEIEHEVIYKAGVQYPIEIKRRFAGVAGALEVLEHAFANLAIERDRLIEDYKNEYVMGLSGDKKFDVARLLAFLEADFPVGLSWRRAEEKGVPFAPGLALIGVGALELTKLHTADRLRPVMKSARFARFLKKFASLEGLAPDSVSHLALVVISVAMINPKALQQQFPEMLLAPSLSWIARDVQP